MEIIVGLLAGIAIGMAIVTIPLALQGIRESKQLARDLEDNRRRIEALQQRLIDHAKETR
jgi:uncharacterized membrane-anchored protein YhcB (DUF1043 family)